MKLCFDSVKEINTDITAEPAQTGYILFLTRYGVVFLGQQNKTARNSAKQKQKREF